MRRFLISYHLRLYFKRIFSLVAVIFLLFGLDGVLYFIPAAGHPLLKFPLYVPVSASKVLKIHYITFTKKYLNIYKTGKDPSVTLEMKAWAEELLDFLDTARPNDQQWLATIYMKSLIDVLSK